MSYNVESAGGGERSNILFLCADQLRSNAVGAYGNEEVHTPNIDRLAAQGVLFENCYAPNPVCAPSRATLMTGRWPHAHGLWANGVSLPESEQFFTKSLADVGYDTGLVGKLHLAACYAGRTERRFDDGLRMFRWAHDPSHRSSENAYHQWLKAAYPRLYETAVDGREQVGFSTLPAEAHYSTWVGNETIEFLETGREADKPFCFIANFYDPHHDFAAPQEYVDKYDAHSLSRPVTRDGELATKPPIQAEASERSYAGHLRGYTEYSAEELQDVKAAYYAMVTLVDDQVGRIIDSLDSAGLADNTLVVFTSDHGEMLGDHQLMLKGPMMYEGAVKVPLIFRWPGILPAGGRLPEFVQWTDLAPTFLDATGVTALPHAQGTSLLPLARGEQGQWDRDWALCEYRNSGHPYDNPVHTTMLRHGRWKLIAYHGRPANSRDRTGELYDLSRDPNELDNLWDDPAHLTTRHELQEMLLDVLVSVEDRTQTRDDFW